MVKKVFIFSLLVIFAVALSGCATTGAVKQKDLEIQGLKNQVSVLETQVQSKDQEINGLREALSKPVELPKVETVEPVKEKVAVNATLKAHHSVKDVQNALKNAGYDPGKIDGHMGKQTSEAIKAFQKANNLTVNGKANKKTWALLGGYLNQK